MIVRILDVKFAGILCIYGALMQMFSTESWESCPNPGKFFVHLKDRMKVLPHHLFPTAHLQPYLALIWFGNEVFDFCVMLTVFLFAFSHCYKKIEKFTALQ